MGVVDPLCEHGLLDLLDEAVLLDAVGDWVGRHVEEQEVLLLRGEDALLHQVLGQPLTHVLQLVPSQIDG